MKASLPSTALLLGLALASAQAQHAWHKVTPAGFQFNSYTLPVMEEFSVGYGGRSYLISTYPSLRASYRSQDRGQSWTKFTPALADAKGRVSTLEMGGVVALPNGDLFCWSQYETPSGKGVRRLFGVFRSQDQGSNWTAVLDSMPGTYGRPMLTAGRGGKYLYLASLSSDISAVRTLLVSKDNGGHWTRAGELARVLFLAADPDDDLYLSGELGPNRLALWRSRDQGASWDSLYSKGGSAIPQSLTADRAGSVMLGMLHTDVAIAVPPADSFLYQRLPTDNGAVKACSFAPGGGAVASVAGMGIYFSNAAFDDWPEGDGDIGSDALDTRLLQYDDQGDLYARAGNNVYVLRAAGSAMHAGGGDYRLLHPASETGGYDLEGRRIGASRPAQGWRARARPILGN